MDPNRLNLVTASAWISEYNYRQARRAYERGDMAYAAWAQAMAAAQSLALRRHRNLEPMPETIEDIDAEHDAVTLENERIKRLSVAMLDEREARRLSTLNQVKVQAALDTVRAQNGRDALRRRYAVELDRLADAYYPNVFSRTVAERLAAIMRDRDTAREERDDALAELARVRAALERPVTAADHEHMAEFERSMGDPRRG